VSHLSFVIHKVKAWSWWTSLISLLL
jgi:hypothetical protein